MKRRDFLGWSAAACTGLSAAAALGAEEQQDAKAAADATNGAEKNAEEDSSTAKEVDQPPPPPRALLEWRTYQVADAEKQAVVAKYLEESALPAWERLKLSPVGVFSEVGEDPALCLHVLVTYADAAQFVAAREALEADDKYRASASEYLAVGKDSPAFVRIESSLLLSFTGMPQPEKPQKSPRLYELRTYESHSESKARRKVEMFNDGEIPIFRDCGFEPVFFGETLIGPRLPNLKYMLAAADAEANKEGWEKFQKHPEWVKMRELPKYADTVSQIEKRFLVPTPYSQL